MKLEQSFEVAAPLDQVWKALIDVERVAPCLPGASITGRNDDGSYAGTFSVKIGPTSASYTGKLQMESVDESAHTATMQANGTDKRGQGGAKATIVSTLSPSGEKGTRVDVITDYRITGRLARFGRGGMIEDISERLLREFAQCLQTAMGGSQPGAEAAATPPAPAPGESPGEADESAALDEPAPIGEDLAQEAQGNGAAPAAAPIAEAPASSAQAPSAEAPTVVTQNPFAETPVSPAEAPTVVTQNPLSDARMPPAEPAETSVPPAETSVPPADAAAPATPPEPAWTPPEASEPVEGLSLMASVMWDRTRRNPKPAIAFLLGSLLAFIVLRRARR